MGYTNYIFLSFLIFIVYCVSIESYSNDGWSSINHVYTDTDDGLAHKIFKRQSSNNNGCKSFQYLCASGECIDKSAVCDGFADCSDRSDEIVTICGNSTCPKNQFRCWYGACINYNLICNGRSDCADDSDESEFTCRIVLKKPIFTNVCSEKEFRCKSGDCIKSNLVCNAKFDCDDGSDETQKLCENTECLTEKEQFQCAYGACTNVSGLCDHITQCPDGSDEWIENCPIRTTTTRRPYAGHHGNHGYSVYTYSYGNSCTVPSYQEIDFQVSDFNGSILTNATSGSKVPLLSKIIVSCKQGYGFESRNADFESVCYQSGSWFPMIPNCIKTCIAPYAPNMEFTCRRMGQLVNCTGDLLVGTSVRPLCAALYNPDTKPYYKWMTCQKDGTWDQILYKCIPECGLQSQVPLISDGRDVKMYGDSPWHVTIYMNIKKKKRHQLICGGTLIHPKIVVSAAHCFYDETIPAPRNNTEDFEIFVRKIKSDYNENTDKYKIEKFVYPERSYDPIPAGHRGNDIILIILKKQVKLSMQVLPACLSYKESHGFNPGENTLGKLSGFGLDESNRPAEILQTAELPFVSYNKCLTKTTHVTIDKFCAGGDTGPGAQSGDSGGGLMFRDPKNGLYYLRGVVSSKESDVTKIIATFTDISWYTDLIDTVRSDIDKEIQNVRTTRIADLKRSPPNSTTATTTSTTTSTTSTTTTTTEHPISSCTIPAEREFNFTVTHAKDGYLNISTEGSKAPQFTKIEIRCNEGYVMKDNTSPFYAVCFEEETWVPQLPLCTSKNTMIISLIDPINQEMRKPVDDTMETSTSIEIYNSKNTLLNIPLMLSSPKLLDPIAIAHRKCAEYTKNKFDNLSEVENKESFYKETNCTINFTGKTNDTGESRSFIKDFTHLALIGYGTEQSIKKVHWACAGTLISERYVLSAAHCATTTHGNPKWVVLGITHTAELTTADFNTNLFKVEKYIIHPKYQPSKLENNVLLLKLEKPIKISSKISPACLYTTHQIPISLENSAKLISWGKANTSETSHREWTEMDVQIKASSNCSGQYENAWKIGYNNDDMVCVGIPEYKVGMCNEVGGSLYLPLSIGENTDCVWTQIGIASFIGAPFCGDRTPAIFTKVSTYIEWIQSVVWPQG